MNACPVNMSEHGSVRQYKEKKDIDDDDDEVASDLMLATRRVEAAICAFGGTVNNNNNRSQQTWSIFRLKGMTTEAEARRRYEKCLPGRYYMSGTQITWGCGRESSDSYHSEREGRARWESVRRQQQHIGSSR